MEHYHPRFHVLSGITLLIVILAWLGVYVRNVERYQRPNALHKASYSPYLLACRFQAVQWRDWSKEAFEQARRKNKLVLVDIGAFWSGSCARLNQDWYNDPRVVSLMNQNFVPIKLDSEAYPQLSRWLRIQARLFYALDLEKDSEKIEAKRVDEHFFALNVPERYPVVLLLTPDGQAFQSVDPQNPLFLQILEQTSRMYRQDHEQVKRVAEARQKAFRDFLVRQAQKGEFDSTLDQLNDNLAKLSLSPDDELLRRGDPSWLSQFQYRLWQAEHGTPALQEEAGKEVRTILLRLRESRLYDRNAGGFYALAEGLENGAPVGGKRLRDNALLLDFYSRAYRLTKDPLLAKTADELLNFLQQSFWSEHPVRAFRAALAPPTNKSILEKSIEPPPINPSIYADDNAIAICALLTYQEVFPASDKRTLWARTAARQTFETLRSLRSPEEGLYHSTNRQASDWLNDEVWIVRAGLRLYETFKDRRPLEFAESLLENHLLLAPEVEERKVRGHLSKSGGFYDIVKSRFFDQMRVEPIQVGWDDEMPSENGMMVITLLEMEKLTGKPKYRQIAQQTLQTFAGSAPGYGPRAAGFAEALAQYLQTVKTTTKQ